MEELALSDSELVHVSHADYVDVAPSKPRSKVTPRSCHVRSHSIPLTKSASRPKTLRIGSLVVPLALPTRRSPLVSSPSLPILTVDRSSLTLSSRHKTLVLTALVLFNVATFLWFTSSSYITYDQYPEEVRSRMAQYNDGAETAYTSQYSERDYCPSQRRTELSVSMSFRDPSFMTKVAIVLAITSKAHDARGALYKITKRNMATVMPTFRSLLPSFCKTASFGYDYHFFFGYDIDDPYFTQLAFRSLFANTMLRYVTLYCPGGSRYAVHFVQCTHTKHVSWAQNDAVMEAYLAGMDYFYRINDDTIMQTRRWTEHFIWTLGHLDPANVGVVGPNHQGGNSKILTYEFVHRTHIEIQGYHYPRENGDWDDDVWITKIYRPTRSIQLGYIHLQHTQEQGRRYVINTMTSNDRRRVTEEARRKIQRYIKLQKEPPIEQDPRKVISMSVSPTDSTQLWGAVRNALLRRTVYPDWSLRVYVSCGAPISARHEEFATDVDRILKTLRTLSVDVRMVDDDVARQIPPSAWNLLALDDDDLDLVLLRNPDERLSDRDRSLVDRWTSQWNRTDFAVHCIRDHPAHADLPIVHGLWAVAPEFVQNVLTQPVQTLMLGFATTYAGHAMDFGQKFVTDVLWPLIGEQTICHDSITCRQWNNTVRFDESREGVGFIGRKYNQHEEVMYPYDMAPFSHLAHHSCH